MHFSRSPGDGAVDFGSGAQRPRLGPGPIGPRGARRRPRGHLAGLRGHLQVPLVSLQPSRISFTPLAVAPEAQGRDIRVAFLTPRSLNSAALWVKFTNAFFVPPLRTRSGGSAYLRFAAPRHTKVPRARLYTRTRHVPPPCPLSLAPGSRMLRASPPSHPLQASSPRPGAPGALPGPCLQLGTAPRLGVHRPPGAASEQTDTSEDVCSRSGCSGEGNFIYFYCGFSTP